MQPHNLTKHPTMFIFRVQVKCSPTHISLAMLIYLTFPKQDHFTFTAISISPMQLLHCQTQAFISIATLFPITIDLVIPKASNYHPLLVSFISTISTI